MKKLNGKEVNSMLKKYTNPKVDREILRFANITENHVAATDSHQLIKIDRNIIESEFFINETSFYNPSEDTFVESAITYPNVDRLFPQINNTTILSFTDIERLIKVLQYIKKTNKNKKNEGTYITTLDNKMILSSTNENEFFTTDIKIDYEMKIVLNYNFFLNALSTAKKVMKNCKLKEITMNVSDSLRPISFFTSNNEIQCLIVPIRLTDYSTFNKITLSDNQELFLEPTAPKEKTIKMPIIENDGIKNKQVKEYKEINDFKTYTLSKEDQEESYTTLYAELDGHLFNIARVGQFDKLSDYTLEKIKEHYKNTLEKQLKPDAKYISKGLFEFFGMMEEYELQKEKINEIRKLNEIKFLQERQERKLLEEQQKLKEIEKRESELIELEKQFLEGEYISNMDFYDLLEKYSITVPLKLRGWIYNKLVKVSLKNCNWYTESKTIWKYINLLQSTLEQKREIVHN